MRSSNCLPLLLTLALCAAVCSSRAQAPGEVDTSFQSTALFPISSSFTSTDQISRLQLQPDGKILATGNIRAGNRNFFVRLLPNGASDEPFQQTQFLSNGTIIGQALLPDGSILTGGSQSINGVPQNRGLYRFGPDGTFDPSFVTQRIITIVNMILVQPDGKILAAGNNSGVKGPVVRYNADGTLDATFNANAFGNASVTDLLLLPDGKIIVSGIFTTFNGADAGHIVRLNPDGSTDPSFQAGTGGNGTIYEVRRLDNGKLIIAGDFTTYNGIPQMRVARLNADGSLDETFSAGEGANAAVRMAVPLADGRLVAVGFFTTFGGHPRNGIVRLNPNGDVDPLFYSGSGTNSDGVPIMVCQNPDGSLLVGGRFYTFNGSPAKFLVRLHNTDQVVRLGSLPANSFCGGTTVDVPYTVTARFNAGNVFTVQLSDASGSFASPVTIGTTLVTGTGSISAAIPAGIVTGAGYRIRLTSSNPASITADNGTDLTLYQKPAATIAYPNDGSLCASGGSAPVLRTGTPEGRYWSSSPNLLVDAATGAIDLSASQAGSYTVHYRAGNGVCDSITTTTAVHVFAVVATSITYTGSPYCTSTGTALPFFSGFNGGTFTASPSGLSLNPSTGAVNIAASQAGNYTVTYTAFNGACTIVATAPVSIRPNPGAVTDNRTFCGGTTTTPIGFGAAPGLSYVWTNDNPSIGLPASGSGSIPSFNAVNDGSVNAYANIRVSASGGTGCDLKQASFRLTVKPQPSVGAVADQALCAGSLSAPVTFAGSVGGTVYSWTNSNASIGLAATGTGDIAPFYAVNNNAAPGNIATGTVTVTPIAQNCSGAMRSFVLTVRPSAGTLSYNGAPFCASGTAYPNLHGSAGGTFSVQGGGPGLVLNAQTGVLNLAASTSGSYMVAYTHPAATCNSTATVTVVIKATAPAVTLPNQVYCAGTAVAPLSFGGTFSWTNTNASIGLPALGTGSVLPAFTALNSGNVPQYAQVNVTPNGDANSCPGRVTAFRITVNPMPSVNPVPDYDGPFCRNSVVDAIAFTGPVAGTQYNWTVSSLAPGFPAPRGTNTVNAFLAQNPTGTTLSASMTVTPIANKCTGAARVLPFVVGDCTDASGPFGPGNLGRAVAALQVEASPNPASGPVQVRISGGTGPYIVEIRDMAGLLRLPAARIAGTTATLTLDALRPGTYYLVLTDLHSGQRCQRLLVRL